MSGAKFTFSPAGLARSDTYSFCLAQSTTHPHKLATHSHELVGRWCHWFFRKQIGEAQEIYYLVVFESVFTFMRAAYAFRGDLPI